MIKHRRYKSRFDRITQATLLAAVSLLALELGLKYWAYYTMVN